MRSMYSLLFAGLAMGFVAGCAAGPVRTTVRTAHGSVTAPSGIPLLRRQPDAALAELLPCYATPADRSESSLVLLRLRLSRTMVSVEVVDRRDEEADRVRGCVEAVVRRWEWDVPVVDPPDIRLVFER